MITKIIKMIPKTFYIVDGIEFGDELLDTLDNIVNIFNSWVSELDIDYKCAEKLFELGYLDRKYIYYDGVLYHDTEDKKAAALLNEILKM